MADNDLDLDKTRLYEETYKLRGVGGGFSISVPKVVVKRKAKEKGMTVEEFREKHRVKVYFNGLNAVDGAFEFVEKDTKE